jgi:haloacid dehalogenase-like hydrolase/Transposase IS200 like
MSYATGCHTVFHHRYHIVWVTKYRYKVLEGTLRERIRTIIRQVCQPMYFIALATDYDGTIPEDGVVADATLEALHELEHSGRKLLLVTGRQLPDLKNVLPEIALFDVIVAENGGLLFAAQAEEAGAYTAPVIK